LLLDEIAGGLTDAEVVELSDVIRTLQGEGIAVLWIEHVVRALLSTVDRLLCLATAPWSPTASREKSWRQKPCAGSISAGASSTRGGSRERFGCDEPESSPVGRGESHDSPRATPRRR